MEVNGITQEEFDIEEPLSNYDSYLVDTNNVQPQIINECKPQVNLTSLPHQIMIDIFLFLDIQDMFRTLPCVSREFYSLIQAFPSKFRATLYQKKLQLSTGIMTKGPGGIKEEKILGMLLNPQLRNLQIPFYGYSTNGGFYQLSEYWIDTIFIQGLWNICSREYTKNINIAGSIIENQNNPYSTYIRNYSSIHETIDNICRHIKYCFNGENLPFNYIKRVFHRFNEEDEVYKLLEQQYQSQQFLNCSEQQKERKIGIVKIAMDLFQKISLSKRMHLPVQEFYIEDKETKLCNKTINIISGVQISREGDYNCPVKTLMVFGSDSRISVDKNDFLDSFNDINQDFILESFLGKRNIRLTDTNIPIIRSKSKFFDNETAFKFAVFSQPSSSDNSINFNESSSDIFPIAWVQFSSSQIDNIAIQFRKLHYFNCKHVALKLIDCDNRIQEPENHASANIDINYVQFIGVSIVI